MKKIIKTEKEMQEVALQIAKQISPGDVFFLRGDLGAGKTTFVRGVLKALGYEGKVKSPTYTLVESYRIDALVVHHFDLYRLKSEIELEEIGFSDYVDDQAVAFIEWPGLAASFVSQPKIISIEIKGNEREFCMLE